MDKITLTRKDLYELIWSAPLRLLAKKYNISDTGLRKICNRLEVPLPKGGHWNKLKFGKKVSVRPLADKSDLEQPITLILREAGAGILFPLTLLRQEIEEKHKSELRVPTRLTVLMHWLLLQNKASDKETGGRTLVCAMMVLFTVIQDYR